MYCIDFFFFFKQKTAYEMRISDWSSDVCSSDLRQLRLSALFVLRKHVAFRLATGRAMANACAPRGFEHAAKCHRAVDHGLGRLVEEIADDARPAVTDDTNRDRSEERPVGEECVRTCRSRWSP